MANRAYCSQFSYSFERQAVKLMGAFTISQVLATASLEEAPLTFTAASPGDAGNDISIELVDPGEESDLIITVDGNAISVILEHDGVDILTDYTALAAALEADSDVTDLISTSGTGSDPVAPLAETNLAGGADSIISSNAPASTMSMVQIGEGRYKITLVDNFQALIACNISLQSETPQFTMMQMESAAVAFGSSKSIIINAINADAENVDLEEDNVLYVDLTLRNASVA